MIHIRHCSLVIQSVGFFDDQFDATPTQNMEQKYAIVNEIVLTSMPTSPWTATATATT